MVLPSSLLAKKKNLSWNRRILSVNNWLCEWLLAMGIVFYDKTSLWIKEYQEETIQWEKIISRLADLVWRTFNFATGVR